MANETDDETHEAAEAQWHREHALEVAVDSAHADWVFQTMAQGDPYEFWTGMLRQAKALPKFIREEALQRGVDADAILHKDGKWYGTTRVYDRRARRWIEHPVIAVEERNAAIRERRSRIRVVERGES